MKDNTTNIEIVTASPSKEIAQWLKEFFENCEKTPAKPLTEGEIEKMTIARIKIDQGRNV